MRPKHKRDHKHVKSGWIGGNPRYRRKRRKPNHKDRTMKGLGQR